MAAPKLSHWELHWASETEYERDTLMVVQRELMTVIDSVSRTAPKKAAQKALSKESQTVDRTVYLSVQSVYLSVQELRLDPLVDWQARECLPEFVGWVAVSWV